MSVELTPEQRAAALKKPPSRPRARRPEAPPEPSPPVDPAPAVPLGPSPAPARLRLKLRTAGQAFLPVLSKLSKLADDVDECAEAITEALAAGVDPAKLRLELEYAAGKNGVDWSLVPAQIQGALATAPQAAADGTVDDREG